MYTDSTLKIEYVYAHIQSLKSNQYIFIFFWINIFLYFFVFNNKSVLNTSISVHTRFLLEQENNKQKKKEAYSVRGRSTAHHGGEYSIGDEYGFVFDGYWGRAKEVRVSSFSHLPRLHRSSPQRPNSHVSSYSTVCFKQSRVSVYIHI